MKQLLKVYIFITFIVTGYSLFTTSERDRFGKDLFSESLMWPIDLFEYIFEPEIDGGSPDELIDSMGDLIESRSTYNERYLAAVAFNQVILLDYVNSHSNLTKTDIKKLITLSKTNEFANSINFDKQSQERVANNLDGFNYDKLVEVGGTSYKKVVKISKKRPVYTLSEDCVGQLVRAYREERGPDSLIKYDILQEFNEMCGLPREEW